jgi:hypothetical protein
MDVRGLGKRACYSGLIMVLGLCGLSGCVSTGAKKGIPEQPPVRPVCQVQSLWHGQIATAPDTAHQGAQLPGLVGRVYLLDQDLATGLKGKGKLVVDLYDSEQKGADGQPRLLEHYEFPEDVLNRLLRKDTVIGWGYTIFLPWPEYRPEIKRPQIKMCFVPQNGTSLFAQPTQLALRRNGGPLPVERVLPVSARDVSQTGNTIPMRLDVTNPGENH